MNARRTMALWFILVALAAIVTLMLVAVPANPVHGTSRSLAESWATWMPDPSGAGPTISGALSTDDTWGPGSITITGDILISPGTIITLAPGTTIQMATTDGGNLGTDPNRIEVMVAGSLRASGPITFTSQGIPPACSDWYGIRFLPGSDGNLRGALVEQAVHGVELNTSHPITIADSTLRANCHKPLSGDAWGAGLTILTGTHEVINTQIYSNSLQATGWLNDARGAGVWLAAGSTLFADCLVHSNTAQSSGHDAFGGGLALWGGGRPTLRNCQVHGNLVHAANRALGGGVDIRDADAVMEADTFVHDNVITATSGAAYGGGISVGSLERIPAPVIRNSRVTTNTCFAQAVVGCYGGGIGFAFFPPSGGQTQALLLDSTIAGNTNLGQAAKGGGIGMDGSTSASLFDGNVIHDNVAQARGRGAFGGGICLVSVDGVRVTNNLIVNNQAHDPLGLLVDGGGLYANGPNAYVSNNTIANNAAVHGGGVYLVNGVLLNTIVVGNTAGSDGGGVYWLRGGAEHNDVWGNQPNDYALTGFPRPANDIVADPLFVAAGDLASAYHLRQGSPCMDAGTDPAMGVPEHDYDHQARPQGAAWDIGFDEVQHFWVGKRVSTAAVTPGDLLSYTVFLSNPDPFASVIDGWIADAIPGHATLQEGPNCSLPTCGQDAGRVWWRGDVPPNTGLTLTFTVVVDYGLDNGTSITNTASYTAGARIGRSNVVTSTLYSPAFTLTKKAQGKLVAGLPLTYTLIVTNLSPSVAGTGVIVTDAVPAGGHWVSGGSHEQGVVTLALPTIPPGEAAGVSWVVSTCQTNLLNQWYRVATSTMHVDSGWGPPLTTDLSVPALVPTFTLSSNAVMAGELVTFTDRSSFNGLPLTKRSWDLGDGEIGTGTPITHTYRHEGSYTITLTITDGCGYTESTSLANAIVVYPTPICTEVTGVELTLVTTDDIEIGDTPLLSADLSPHDAFKPYRFRLTIDGTLGFVLTSSADPLDFSLDSVTAGTHSVGIAVWNCGMTELEATRSTVEMKVPSKPRIYLPVVVKRYGE